MISVIADDDSAMDPANPSDDNLPVSLQLQVDERCVRFESELQSAQNPKIEQFIDGVDEPLRSKVLNELLLIEFEFRGRRGERIELFEFLKRFPADDALVQSAYTQHVSRSKSCILETEAAGNELGGSDGLSSSTPRSRSDRRLSDSSHHGRFLPGTKVADRYRIVSLLGKGGMGEVYRADDLKLGQTVALKFLPRQLAQDEKRLEYFHEEVRLTRQISHPNVCRVYDIGEVDGHFFLSMEYIDGEDLKILLRRIGRLPTDKGVQIAQQLCAGLATAHEKGVLHRDLKPANIMIDGRGQVRITDFGLAKLADNGQDVEVAGTPAYMAPEQLRSGKTSIRSDLYSLGLILYEIFTGEPVNRTGSIQELLQQEDSSPSTPSAVVEDIDPIVERVILRCLEREAHERPNSAHAVAAALPGGDPLAAALAAGETPSPEMVAAAGGAGRLDPRVGGVLLVAIAIGLGVAFWMSKFGDINRIGMKKHPQELAADARRLIQSFGYEEPAVDTAWGFDEDPGLSEHFNLMEQDEVAELIRKMSSEQPALTCFWYRHSPVMLEPRSPSNKEGFSHLFATFGVTRNDPPLTRSGMISVLLDTKGRLIRFLAVPPQRVPSQEEKPIDANWSELLKTMDEKVLGFSLGSLTPVESSWNPAVICDTQHAWEGTYSNGIPIRLETATYRGRPVYFQESVSGHTPNGTKSLFPSGRVVSVMGSSERSLRLQSFLSFATTAIAEQIGVVRCDSPYAF